MSKKIKKSIISITLIFSIIFVSTTSIFAHTYDYNDVQPITNEENLSQIKFIPNSDIIYSNMPDSTIIAIINGEPLYKEDFDSEGNLNKKKIIKILRNNILKSNMNGANDFLGPTLITLPEQYKYKNIYAHATLYLDPVLGHTVPWSQETYELYIPNKNLPAYIKKLESKMPNTAENLAKLIASFIPKIGVAISIGSFLLDGIKSNVITTLKSLSEKGNHALISVNSSRYGSLTWVHSWNGTQIHGKTARLSQKTDMGGGIIMNYKVNKIIYGI